jgi:hypothetical protein
VIKRRIEFSYKAYKMLAFSAFSTCIAGALVPIFTHEIPYRFWFPFDVHGNLILFWVASLYQVMTSLLLAPIGMTLNILPVMFMSFATGLMEELEERFKNIGSKLKTGSKMRSGNVKGVQVKSKTGSKEELNRCIEIHLKIREFVNQIQSHCALTFFIQWLMSSVILCSGVFALSQVSYLINRIA